MGAISLKEFAHNSEKTGKLRRGRSSSVEDEDRYYEGLDYDDEDDKREGGEDVLGLRAMGMDKTFHNDTVKQSDKDIVKASVGAGIPNLFSLCRYEYLGIYSTTSMFHLVLLKKLPPSSEKILKFANSH